MPGHHAAPDHADVVIVGGGHNALVAACYLAKAGRSVVVLERRRVLGGAAVSTEAFPGTGVKLSRYSYLVSLLPQRIIDDLGLELSLRSRRYSSFTPHGAHGLLVDGQHAEATRNSFTMISAAADAAGHRAFGERTTRLAERLWPTFTEPLLRRSEAQALVADAELWSDFIDRPLGEVIERTAAHDVVRGLMLTDALIGTFSTAHATDLQQNICFLYHVVGRGTGQWDVPVGGMGALSAALEAAALSAGAELRTQTEVTAVAANGVVHFTGPDGTPGLITGEHLLANIAPAVLSRLMDPPARATEPGLVPTSRLAGVPPEPEGAQAKVNMILHRLPRMRDAGVTAAQAFGGTLHVNERYSQLHDAHASALAGRLGSPLPVEVYCHSLTDDSILPAALRESGAHTLTAFSLQSPHRLLTGDNDADRQRLQDAVLESINSVLAEPLQDCLMADGSGNPCIETRTTADLAAELGMPGGHIFHGPLSWPFVEDSAALDTPADRWGVATRYPRILLCGSGARRGGGVSGLAGHNAAMALLEDHPGTGAFD